MNKENTASNQANELMDDAQDLISATADIAEAKVAAARSRLASALESGREVLAAVQDKAIAGAKATDQTIRENPYYAVGVALGVGALIGYLLARRN